MDPRDNTYRSWLLADPKAFVAGVRGFCKQAAADEDSLWQRIKPWLLLLGGGYLALKGGERWGRFAQEHNYPQGPVKGPLVAALGALLPPDMKVQGTLTRGEAKLKKLIGSGGSAENPGIAPPNGYY